MMESLQCICPCQIMLLKGWKHICGGKKSNAELTSVVSSNQLPLNRTDHQNNRVTKWTQLSQQELTALYQRQLCDTAFTDGTIPKWISSYSRLKRESNKETILSLISVSQLSYRSHFHSHWLKQVSSSQIWNKFLQPQVQGITINLFPSSLKSFISKFRMAESLAHW